MLPSRQRAARAVQAASVACFVLAALTMVVAGALLAGGRDSGSSLLATSGYGLGIAGIATGVLATMLSPTDHEAPEEL